LQNLSQDLRFLCKIGLYLSSMRPKLHEVAHRTGLSLATVSRVLNGKAGVSTATRRQVLEVLAELGYQEMAPRVGNGVVGIITPELDNPIFPHLAQAIEARLARDGLLAMVCASTSDTANEQDYLDHFLTTEAAGVVVINGRYSQVLLDFSPYDALRDKGFPAVLLNGMGPDCHLPSVSIDIRAAGMAAVRHLTSMGHQRIGCLVGPQKYWSSVLMIEGYRAGLGAADITFDEGLVSETIFTVEGGTAGTAKLLEAGVTGVVTGGDLMALGAIAAARSWSLRVPEDVSVVGFDGTPIIAYTHPPLTTLRQPVARMAGVVAHLLNDQIQGQAGGGLHLFQPELLVGGSTGPAPVLSA
jgi:alanine racemase